MYQERSAALWSAVGRAERRRALALVAGLLLAMLAGCSGSSPQGAPPEPPPPSPHPSGRPPHVLLIHHEPAGVTPAQLAADPAHFDALPFDGVTIALPGLVDDTISGRSVPAAAYRQALAGMPALHRLVHNMVLLRIDLPQGTFEDDGVWQTAARNLAALGIAARDHPDLDGIFLDTEYYGDGPSPWDGAGSDAPLAQQRGRQLGEALATAWPSGTLITTFGPWVGVPETADVGFRGLGYADVSYHNSLMGPFVAGLAEACLARGMRYVDGGELYSLRSRADFARAYDWMKHGLARAEPAVLPAGYPGRVSIGFGVYDADVRKHGYPTLSAHAWARALQAALVTADRYVWTYSDRYDWLGTGRAPAPPAALVRALEHVRDATSS